MEHLDIKWTICSERLPTREDADDYGEIWWCGKEQVRREKLRDVLSWDFTKPWNLNGSWAKTGIKIPSPPGFSRSENSDTTSESIGFLRLSVDEYWPVWHQLAGAAIELKQILKAIGDGTATDEDRDRFGKSVLERVQEVENLINPLKPVKTTNGESV